MDDDLAAAGERNAMIAGDVTIMTRMTENMAKREGFELCAVVENKCQGPVNTKRPSTRRRVFLKYQKKSRAKQILYALLSPLRRDHIPPRIVKT